MAILSVGVLKQIIENLPEHYMVEYDNGTTTTPVSDKVELDISGEKLILK